MIPLVPVGAGAGARAQLYWEFREGGKLVVADLPRPPAGRSYQFWLGSISRGNRVSGGLLMVDSQGAGTLRVAPPRTTWSPDIFGVTVERQGGAREPSDELVLVGELAKPTLAARVKEPSPAAGPPVSAASPETRPEPTPGTAAQPLARSPAPGAETPPPATPVTAAAPQPAPVADGLLVRIVPAPVERTWAVTQSVLRSLGWDLDRTDQADGLIRTLPRNVAFKNLGVYAAGTRHTLDIVVRPVSSSHTSISVKREIFEEQRIFWSKERTSVQSRDTTVEQTVLDAIEHLL